MALPVDIFEVPQIPCGSGLARECGGSVPDVLADTPYSRASPLPHWIFIVSDKVAGAMALPVEIFEVPQIPCGSGLARECG
ncbi:hypothetical protein, partial [Pseudomonas sp.]|uniref:hypothetical protein n=1 Tax=Pseudomonas sp. TaxID=306 RepID=UPI003263B937